MTELEKFGAYRFNWSRREIGRGAELAFIAESPSTSYLLALLLNDKFSLSRVVLGQDGGRIVAYFDRIKNLTLTELIFQKAVGRNWLRLNYYPPSRRVDVKGSLVHKDHAQDFYPKFEKGFLRAE